MTTAARSNKCDAADRGSHNGNRYCKELQATMTTKKIALAVAARAQDSDQTLRNLGSFQNRIDDAPAPGSTMERAFNQLEKEKLPLFDQSGHALGRRTIKDRSKEMVQFFEKYRVQVIRIPKCPAGLRTFTEFEVNAFGARFLNPFWGSVSPPTFRATHTDGDLFPFGDPALRGRVKKRPIEVTFFRFQE
jgi:hypothetical protein